MLVDPFRGATHCQNQWWIFDESMHCISKENFEQKVSGKWFFYTNRI